MPFGLPQEISYQMNAYNNAVYSYNSAYPVYVPTFPQSEPELVEPEPTVLDWLRSEVDEICELARVA